MRRLQSISHRLRNLLHKERVERETDQELHFHLERQIAEHAAAGMSPEEARHAALLEFGGVEQIQGRVPRSSRREAYRITPRRSALWFLHASKESRLHNCERTDAGPGHRRELRRPQHGECPASPSLQFSQSRRSCPRVGRSRHRRGLRREIYRTSGGRGSPLDEWMAHLIFGVVSVDFAILGGFTALLVLVALGAGYFPARRAMSVDPMVSLRYE